MKLIINAIPTTPGGGLTVLVGLLKGWRLIGCDMEIAVVAGNPETYEVIKATGMADQVEPVRAGEGAWANFLWQNNHFRRFVREFGADVVVTNNHYLFGLPRPAGRASSQSLAIHHRRLRRRSQPGNHESGARLDFSQGLAFSGGQRVCLRFLTRAGREVCASFGPRATMSCAMASTMRSSTKPNE